MRAKTMNGLKWNMCALIMGLIFTFPTYSQIPKPISVQLGGGVGYVLPGSDYGGTTMDFYSGTKYGLSSGLNIQGKARFALIGVNLVGELNYSSLSNNGYSEPGQGNVELSQKILSLRVGPEFKLDLPALPFTPYVGANIALNRFSGDFTFQGVARVSSADYSMQSATRFGFGISGGALFKMSSFILDIGIEYNLLNVFGKSWQDANPTIDQRLDSYLSLNDDMDPAYSTGNNTHIVGSSRTINSFAITATAMFGL